VSASVMGKGPTCVGGGEGEKMRAPAWTDRVLFMASAAQKAALVE
jgi:hypothetical protein